MNTVVCGAHELQDKLCAVHSHNNTFDLLGNEGSVGHTGVSITLFIPCATEPCVQRTSAATWSVGEDHGFYRTFCMFTCFSGSTRVCRCLTPSPLCGAVFMWHLYGTAEQNDVVLVDPGSSELLSVPDRALRYRYAVSLSLCD